MGLSDTLAKGVINKTSAFSFLIAIAIMQVPVAVVYFKLTKHKFRTAFVEMKNSIKDYKYAILGGLFNILGTGALYISFNYALASIASPITGGYSAFVSIYALTVLKEKVSKINKLGIVVTVVGLIAILILG